MKSHRILKMLIFVVSIFWGTSSTHANILPEFTKLLLRESNYESTLRLIEKEFLQKKSPTISNYLKSLSAPDWIAFSGHSYALIKLFDLAGRSAFDLNAVLSSTSNLNSKDQEAVLHSWIIGNLERSTKAVKNLPRRSTLSRFFWRQTREEKQIAFHIDQATTALDLLYMSDSHLPSIAIGPELLTRLYDFENLLFERATNEKVFPVQEVKEFAQSYTHFLQFLSAHNKGSQNTFSKSWFDIYFWAKSQGIENEFDSTPFDEMSKKAPFESLKRTRSPEIASLLATEQKQMEENEGLELLDDLFVGEEPIFEERPKIQLSRTRKEAVFKIGKSMSESILYIPIKEFNSGEPDPWPAYRSNCIQLLQKFRKSQ